MPEKEYDRELRGALFVNDRRREGKDDPQLNGQCQINGVEFWVNAWKKTSSKGAQFYSLSFRAKENQTPAEDDDDLL